MRIRTLSCAVAFLVAAVLAQAQTIFLVRHAEITAEKTDAKLSDIGLKRAECLAATLKDSGITAIFTSQVTRTKQTAEPLAKVLKITPQDIDALNLDEFARQIRGVKTGNVLVVGHSNTVPGIINKLTSGAMKDMADDDFDTLFIVDLAAPGHPTPATLHYCIQPSATVGTKP